MAKWGVIRQSWEIEAEYSHAEAVAFVEECERKGIRILGMDFLRREGERITPINSTNWQGIGTEESWHEARSLLQEGIPDGGNVVIFVTDDR